MAQIGIVQLPARHGDLPGQLALLASLLDEAPPHDLVLLPETALTGYVSTSGDFDLTPFAEPLDGPTVRHLRALAVRHQTTLIAPLVERHARGCANALVWIDPSAGLRGIYRKRHPWYPERWATPGSEPFPLWQIAGLNIVPAICFDLHFLGEEAAPVLEQADLLLFASAWVDSSEVDSAGEDGPDDLPAADSRTPLLETLARSYDVAIANANWGVGRPRVIGQGGSRFLDADGTERARIDDGVGVLSIELLP